MPLRTSAGGVAISVLMGLWVSGACAVEGSLAQASAHDPPAAASTDASSAAVISSLAVPTAAQIRAAAAQLRADPNLGTPHEIRSLQWVRGKASPPPDSPTWIVGLFEFLGQTASLLLWLAGSVVAALAIIWIYRLLRARAPRAAGLGRPAVSHISGLDIRPASLPDDVGAAALSLLEAGKTREALSLLYRGALSRAVHRHGVAIQESFTEGEALRAVESRLDRPRVDYFRELLALWQRAMYAGQVTAAEPVAALCSNFGATLGDAPSLTSAP